MDDTPKWEREGFKDDGSLACLGLTTDTERKHFACPQRRYTGNWVVTKVGSTTQNANI